MYITHNLPLKWHETGLLPMTSHKVETVHIAVAWK